MSPVYRVPCVDEGSDLYGAGRLFLESSGNVMAAEWIRGKDKERILSGYMIFAVFFQYAYAGLKKMDNITEM
jgi:hypothetical protein